MPNINVSVRITGSLITPEILDRVVNNTLEGLAKDVKVDFGVTTQTWRERPLFEITKGDRSRTVSTDMATKMGRIYGFLNFGTRIRYATMTPDFSPKTMVRYIGSHVGSGGLLFVSRLHPRPGIQPRQFAEEIAKKWQALAGGILQRAIDAEVR